ncbi:hypothetical protein AHAT_36860 [Agarivorans sp. Toyoura001]|uniref:hypothetical protein n=1 Tax=Agarivorans sp. Toyoura001 TaxID=2283141 RepID=UPI0010D3D892|nr:hypothetical protein [Agarivorans sp. Toyoura001]GDY27796.1 hypothetical protein AHAT_36860 [Agarivorans sp. Toyoura001]
MNHGLRYFRQQGAALFVAMLFLLILSFLGGVLLSAANQGLKVVSAMGDRLGAEHSLEGEMNQLIWEPNLQGVIGSMAPSASMAVSTMVTGASGSLIHTVDSVCARSFSASSNNAITQCRYIRVDATKNYGKANRASTSIAAGIEQPIL